MQILESELEQYLFDNYKEVFKQEVFDEEFVYYPVEILRQVKLGGYGIIDLLVIYPDQVLIIELKQNEIQFDAFGQICRYLTGLDDLLNTEKITRSPISVSGLLIGSGMGTSDVCYALTQTGIKFWKFKVDLKTGIGFEKTGGSWSLINNGFGKDTKDLAKKLKPFIKFKESKKNEVVQA